ncbi:Cation transporter HKT8 [Frankliniella fusca]|uniref:Cation transporter HKT8 n=1 Tax=Frankliniella fusca TaxID=407009 RepID=A0AAE1LPE7_9NEOP|nr:Cation transporter HKT8 [Frankliniella fusca]
MSVGSTIFRMFVPGMTIYYFLGAPAACPLCHTQVHVALTDPDDGSVFLYSGFTACSEPIRPEASERDRWAASEGRWQRGGVEALFRPVCTAWRPPPEGQPMSIFVVPMAARVAVGTAKNPAEHVVTRSLTEALLLAPHLMRLVRPVPMPGNATGALWSGQDCRLDLMAAMESLQSRRHGRLVSYAWGMTNMVAVVPAGLGLQPGLLHQLTNEFTASMWCATGLSALLVAAGLVAVARAGVVLAMMQSLAILLGQSAPGGSDLLWTPHQRSVLGSWLLVCVVVATAYTGQLLTNLAVVTPHYEINSMEALARSNLEVLVTAGTTLDHLPSEVRGKVRPGGSNVSAILEVIAERRDSATFIDSSKLGLLVPLLRHPRKVFAFKAPLERLTSFFLSSPGSPFQVPLHRTLSRLRAAGIIVFWLRVGVEEYVRSFNFLETERLESEDPQDSQEILDNYYLHYRRTVQTRPPRPLGASHAAPAFLLLAVGLAVAILVFLLEATPCSSHLNGHGNMSLWPSANSPSPLFV